MFGPSLSHPGSKFILISTSIHTLLLDVPALWALNVLKTLISPICHLPHVTFGAGGKSLFLTEIVIISPAMGGNASDGLFNSWIGWSCCVPSSSRSAPSLVLTGAITGLWRGANWTLLGGLCHDVLYSAIS